MGFSATGCPAAQTYEVRMKTFSEIKESIALAVEGNLDSQITLGEENLLAQAEAQINYSNYVSRNTGKQCKNPSQAKRVFYEEYLEEFGLKKTQLNAYSKVVEKIGKEQIQLLGGMTVSIHVCADKVSEELRSQILTEVLSGERFTENGIKERIKLALEPPRVEPLTLSDEERDERLRAAGIDAERMNRRIRQQIEINDVIADAEAVADYDADQMEALANEIHTRLMAKAAEYRRQDMVIYTDDQYPDNPLVVLGLEEGYSKREVTKAYRKLASEVHPDHGGTDSAMALVTWARDQLLNNL